MSLWIELTRRIKTKDKPGDKVLVNIEQIHHVEEGSGYGSITETTIHYSSYSHTLVVTDPYEDVKEAIAVLNKSQHHRIHE